MRILMTRPFARWAAKEDLALDRLRQAVEEMERGLIDASLGGFLVKKRIAGSGRGKRGGFRTIIAFRAGERVVFLEGFAKNEKDNVTTKELEALKLMAETLMALDEPTIDKLVADGAMLEA